MGIFGGVRGGVGSLGFRMFCFFCHLLSFCFLDSHESFLHLLELGVEGRNQGLVSIVIRGRAGVIKFLFPHSKALPHTIGSNPPINSMSFAIPLPSFILPNL